MSSFPQPPGPGENDITSPAWLIWFQNLRNYTLNPQNVHWGNIDLTGSNLNQLVTRNHNDLQSVQGGSSNNYWHLTQAIYNVVSVNTGQRTISASTTLSGTTDHTILVNASGGAVIPTLPAANSVPAGKTYIIKKIDASANAVTITAAGADLIDGAATKAITTQYTVLRIESDGVSNWWIW